MKYAGGADVIDRIRWWLWFLRSPSVPSAYNLTHRAKITRADYDIMVDRWEWVPLPGAPRDVVEHRKKQTASAWTRQNWK